MKLLALHGHLQNAKRFKGQTNALARHLGKCGVQLVFIDAPFILPNSPEDSPFRTWAGNNSIEESLNAVLKAHEDNPDIVGLFGFSMGAMLALKIASLIAGDPNSPFGWVKIIVSASAPFAEDNTALMPSQSFLSAIPILFVMGRTDEIAPIESQRKYLQYFANTAVYEHDGGHYIPSAKALIQPFIDFFAAHSEESLRSQ